MSKLFTIITSVSPGIIVVWVIKWIGIFDGSSLQRPNANIYVLNLTAASLSTVLIVIVVAIFSTKKKYYLKYYGLTCLILMIGFLFTIIRIRYILSWFNPRDYVESLYLFWDMLYIGFLISMVVSLPFFILYFLRDQQDKPQN